MISVDVALALGSFHLDVAFENDEGITALFGRSGAGKSTTTLVSYLGRVVYNYDRRYYLTGSFHADASSRFGPETGGDISAPYQQDGQYPMNLFIMTGSVKIQHSN